MDKALLAELQRHGYTVTVDRWPPKVTLFKRDGEAMPNMPADPYSLQRFLNRGFTLTAPFTPQPKLEEKVGIGDDASSIPITEVKTQKKAKTLKKKSKKGGKANVLSSKNLR